MQVQSTNPTSAQSSQPNSKQSIGSSAAVVATPKTILSPPSALNGTSAIGQNSEQTQAKSNSASEQVSFSEKDLKMNQKKTNRIKGKKQIPTILGLLVLFIALISGVLLFGQGTGVFAPRATPETTPKNIRISNVTDKTFTISFFTDESTVAFVKYGEDASKLDKQASDDRDQLSGIVKDYRLHHITVRNLSPGKNYFYVLGTGTSTFDNEGQPYSLSTAAKPAQSPSNNQTLYGNILKADSTPAEGAVVYVYAEGMGALSALVKASGSWGISLANAFNTEKTNYAEISDDSSIEIKVQGIDLNLVNNLKTTVASAQPVIELVLGEDSAEASSSAEKKTTDVDKEELLAATESSATESSEASSGGIADLAATSSSLSSETLQDMLSSTTSTTETQTVSTPEVLNLNEIEENKEASATTLTTTQPQIKVNLPANTMVRLVVHSDTAIDETLQTDANGDVILDVASLGQNLEPGEHTATYTYIDPVTGKEVTKTYNFVVDPTATRQLASVADLNMVGQTTPTTTPTPKPSIPYGSGNPYTPTVTVIPTASASPTIVSTRSAVVSTTSGQYNSGSVGTTLTLLLGGLFFVMAGIWSYFLATSFEKKRD